MKSIRFHPAAATELEAEAKFYEHRSAGLGERFLQEVEAAIALAARFPEIGSPYKHGTRRVFPRKFPFSVVYTEQSSGLVILAIAPFLRKSGYWRNRRIDDNN